MIFDKNDVRRVIRKLRPFDNMYMKIFFEDYECTQVMLRIILNKPDLVVKDIRIEHEIKDIHEHSVRLDIRAEDSEGVVYNIEIQCSSSGAGKKRARRNSSMLDAECENPGLYGEGLPETFVIFITEHDVLGWDLPIYHINRYIEEVDKLFDDEEHIIYVNAERSQDDTLLGKLMHDLKCSNPDDMVLPEFRRRDTYFKESEKGESFMSDVLMEFFEPYGEKIRTQSMKKGRKEGRKEGMEKERGMLILKMRLAGMSQEQIDTVLSMPVPQAM